MLKEKLYVVRAEFPSGIGTSIVIKTLGTDGAWYLATNSALKLSKKQARNYVRPGTFIELVKG